MIICSNEDEERSHFIAKLHLFRKPFLPKCDLEEYRKYLAAKFTAQSEEIEDSTSQYGLSIQAAVVDFERCCFMIH